MITTGDTRFGVAEPRVVRSSDSFSGYALADFLNRQHRAKLRDDAHRGPSEPAGEGGMPDLLLWATAASLMGVSILVPAATGGGWMWLLPAVMVPLLVGWVVLQRMMVIRRESCTVKAAAR
jgi:hypothetical protein